MPDDWEQVAELARARRIELRMSQAEVGTASKTSERTVRLIEKAERSSYHSSTLRAISQVLWDEPEAIERILQGERPTRPRAVPESRETRLDRIEYLLTEAREELDLWRSEREFTDRPPGTDDPPPKAG